MVIEFKRSGLSYSSRLEYVGSIEVKLDTGSPVTVLNYTQLALLLSFSKIQLIKFMEQSNIKKSYFHSYTGDNISTTLCRLRNVRLGEFLINNFYFYLNLDISASGNALIGADFIKCCSVSGHAKDSINLNYCDSMYEPFQQQVLEIDELLLSTDESEFDEAIKVLKGE